jgi:hypothetical protein
VRVFKTVQLNACLPNVAVGHRAGNPAHAAVPPAGPPRHHHRPENHADAGNRKTPQNLPLISLTIFKILQTFSPYFFS